MSDRCIIFPFWTPFFPLNTYHFFSFEHLSPFPLNINLSHSDRALLCQIRFLSLLLTFFLVSTFVSFFLWPCLFLLTCPAVTECPVSGFLHLWPQMTGAFPAENSCGNIKFRSEREEYFKFNRRISYMLAFACVTFDFSLRRAHTDIRQHCHQHNASISQRFPAECCFGRQSFKMTDLRCLQVFFNLIKIVKATFYHIPAPCL